jgi:hypothetical protein
MQSCILLDSLIFVGILNDVFEVIEFIGTLRCCSDGLDACIVVIAAGFIRTSIVNLKCFELIFLLSCCSSLIRLIMFDLFEHDLISLVLRIALFVVRSVLICPEMLINIPKGAVIQLYSLIRGLVIVFENLRRQDFCIIIQMNRSFKVLRGILLGDFRWCCLFNIAVLIVWVVVDFQV